MEALTWKGLGAFPFEIKIIERGKMITGAAHGDKIISYYEVDGKYYASWEDTCSTTNGTIAKAMPDSELPLKTGFLPGDTPEYAVYKFGKYYKVVWDSSYQKGSYELWNAHLSEDVVQISDNLYYSLDPEWPDVDYNIVPYNQSPTTSFSDRYLYKFIQFNKYFPKYYSKVYLGLLTGSGSFKMARDVSKSTYKFNSADFGRGYIELKLYVDPLKNSTSDDTFRIIKLNV